MSELFYTSVTRLFNDIAVRGIKNGKPFMRKVKYEPTLYVKSEKPSGLVTLDGENVAPVQPGTMKDCRMFIDKYEGVENFKVYGQTNYVKQFTNSAFPGVIEFDRSKINVTSIDIEVQSDEGFLSLIHI